MGLATIVTIPEIFRRPLGSDSSDQRFWAFSFAEWTALFGFLTLFLFFLFLAKNLAGAVTKTIVRTSALLAATAQTLICFSLVFSAYVRLTVLPLNALEATRSIVTAIIPTVALTVFLTFFFLNFPHLTERAIINSSAVAAITIGLRAGSLFVSIIGFAIRTGLRPEWSLSNLWNEVGRQSTFLLGFLSVTTFFILLWRAGLSSDISSVMAPISIQNRVETSTKSVTFPKPIQILQILGAIGVIAGSVTYVEPYNTIWGLIGRALLLPGSGIGLWFRPFMNFQGLSINLGYTVIAVAINGALWIAFVVLRKYLRSASRKQ